MSELIQHGGLKPGLCVHLLPGRVILVVKHAGLATPIHPFVAFPSLGVLGRAGLRS